MKQTGKNKWLWLPLLIAGTLIALSLPAFAEEEGVGEYVSEAAPHGQAALIPPGHYGLMAKYANKFLSDNPHRTIYAEALQGHTDEYFLLDIREPGDFCVGHIPGAINIPFKTVAKPENLAMLPVDQPILVICYTGHTASQVNSVLNLLGYNAWTLRFGMMSWRETTSMAVYSSSVKQGILGGDYPMETCP